MDDLKTKEFVSYPDSKLCRVRTIKIKTDYE